MPIQLTALTMELGHAVVNPLAGRPTEYFARELKSNKTLALHGQFDYFTE